MIEVVTKKMSKSVRLYRSSFVYAVIAAVSFGVNISLICFSKVVTDIRTYSIICFFSVLFMYSLLLFILTIVEFYLQKKQEMKEGDKKELLEKLIKILES